LIGCQCKISKPHPGLEVSFVQSRYFQNVLSRSRGNLVELGTALSSPVDVIGRRLSQTDDVAASCGTGWEIRERCAEMSGYVILSRDRDLGLTHTYVD